MSKHIHTTRAGRLRFSPLLLGAGIAAAVALPMSFSGTLSAYTATFLHPDNTVSTASINVAETNAGGTSTTCTTDSSGSQRSPRASRCSRATAGRSRPTRSSGSTSA